MRVGTLYSSVVRPFSHLSLETHFCHNYNTSHTSPSFSTLHRQDWQSQSRFCTSIRSTALFSSASESALLRSRRLISLHGPDALHYLQGAVTANVAPSSGAPTAGFYTAFLNAQGRVLNDVFIYPRPSESGNEEWLVEVDADEAERLLRHIKRYKLRAKFDVRLLDTEEMQVWSVWRDSRDDANGWTAHMIGTDLSERYGGIACVDARAPSMGHRVLLAGGKKPTLDGITEASEQDYTVRRFMRGVAEGQKEIRREIAFPQESNIDYMGGIDYRKGCYVGQELTIRTHHTGVVRKRILPMMLYKSSEAPPNTMEFKQDHATRQPSPDMTVERLNGTGKRVGKWLAGIGNLGLGLCRLDIIRDTSAQSHGHGGFECDEYRLDWGKDRGEEGDKVRAFIPSWHPRRER